MKAAIIAVGLLTLGCQQNTPTPMPGRTKAPVPALAATTPRETTRPDSRRTEFGLDHNTEGCKVTKWDASRSRYFGEPCIDSWTVHRSPEELIVSGTTRSTNTGGLVADVSIYGGNLANSDRLTLLGKSEKSGHFAINVALKSSGFAYDYLYTGGVSEPLVEYQLQVPPKRRDTKSTTK